MRFRKKNIISFLIYGALALIILFPLFGPGYIFALDMVFPPQISYPEPFCVNGFVVHLLNSILPSAVIQKIILFLILFLAGIGMHRLIPVRSEAPKYFAGILYIFNPFVYSRFLFGHLWLLVAYALMPFAVKAIFKFFDKVNFRNALKAAFWLVLIGFISVHFILFVFLFFGIAFLAFIWKNQKGWKGVFKICRYTFLIFLIFLIFSGWWISQYFDETSLRGEYVQHIIGEEDFEAFKTVSDSKYGVLWNVAAMYGFWGDKTNQYTVQKDVSPYWFYLFLIILLLVVLGIVKGFRKNKFKTGIFVVTAMIAFVLSVGVSYESFISIINSLRGNFFVFNGLRDSQKFTALLMLVYAYLGAIGINAILKNSKIQRFKNLKVILAALLIAIPFLYSPLMVWGFKGQLYLSEYPESWFKVNEIFNQDKDDSKAIFFPWHQYMTFRFAGDKIIANPASKFFDKEVIAGDNMEAGKIYTHSKRPISQFVENEILPKKNEIKNLGEMLEDFDIKYVILAKEIEWKSYGFLDRQEDLEIIFESEELAVYQRFKN